MVPDRSPVCVETRPGILTHTEGERSNRSPSALGEMASRRPVGVDAGYPSVAGCTPANPWEPTEIGIVGDDLAPVLDGECGHVRIVHQVPCRSHGRK